MTERIKHPRVFHLPFSQGVSDDDKVLKNTDGFIGKRVIATLKLDGENTSIYNDYVHVRSVDFSSHPSRDWVKSLQGRIGYKIPEGYRICGENVYAKHSIHYKHLDSYFYVFSVWNEKTCLSWSDTVDFCNQLNLYTVPVLYDGLWDENKIKELYTEYYGEDECEGYVVRVADSFNYDEFNFKVGKFVRKNHVKTDTHWMHSKIVLNELKK